MPAKPIILCVDDEKIILDSLQQQIVGRLGKEFEVELAEGGSEALEIITDLDDEGRDLAVVISDQLMPSMRGDDFLIQVHTTHPETMKILLTGQASLEAVRNAINNAGLYRYVAKPWEEYDLMLTVEEAARKYMQYLQLLEHNRYLRSLNKATQELSGEVDLRKLVSKFMINVIENANADQGFLLMEKGDGQLSLEAVESRIKENSRLLAHRLQYDNAALTREVLMGVQQSLESDVFPDYRIVTPINKKSKILGYLYLENPNSREVFSHNQREVLQMLASQAAISMENSNLFARLEERTKELQAEKDKVEQMMRIIEEKNKDMTDSIRYAKRIQQSILPEKSLIQTYFPDSFILYRPKDIVSGDFYWFTQNEKDGKFLIACCDCTGHGVPGAFMTVVGNNLLESITHDFQLSEADAILNLLDFKLRQALRQDTEQAETKDGMDLAMCSIDLKNKRVQFAGAHRPLFLVNKDNELKELPGSRNSIGGVKLGGEEQFYSTVFDFCDQDRIYLFSDGLTDQFGSETNDDRQYKFSTRRFRELILRVSNLPMAEQMEIIEYELDKWRGNREQTDDVLLIGIRLKIGDGIPFL
jgi:serine phosphatase RsbU (regulator of sigma subunit)/FixJ family two-component response regulator